MKYHGLKMEEVNDTMKHLWNKTYQGTGVFIRTLRSHHSDFV
jgi:DNA repair protein RAD50